jgi:PAS domain S-box-containing protein
VSLRQRAEKRAIDSEPRDVDSLSVEDVKRLVHDLEVHKFELEIQNEDLRQTQALLDEARARYFDLYDLAPVGYVTVSEGGLILEANLTFATMLGVPRLDVAERPFSRFVAPEDADSYHLHQLSLFTSGKPAVCVLRMVRQNRELFWVRLQSAVGQAGAGGSTTCRMTVSDISESVRGEEWKRRSAKLQALGTLAQGIAHDFNNILVAIRGNATMASAELPADHPVREYILEIERAGKRATGVVRQVQAFAWPQGPKRVTLPLVPVVDEAVRLMRVAVPAMIEIDTDWEADVPEAAIDPDQVHQAVVNLMTNASQAIGFQKGRIRLRLDSVDVDEEMVRKTPELKPGRYVRLSVRDTGRGMDAETLERAFDPFFTTDSPGKSVGLGLSIVHGIMKSHEGAALVASEPGRGTACELYFPAAEASGLPAVVPLPAELPRACSEHILFVDDDDALIFLARRMLVRLGYRLTTFTNPVAALEAFRKDSRGFDAIVTDISMPEMSGLDFAREVLVLRPGIPIVITSGYVTPENEEAANRLKVSAIIRKPNTVDELAGALDTIFRAVRPSAPAEDPAP